MQIGILSDTHGYFHPALDEVFKGMDLILHAGDIGDPSILDQLEKLAPVKAVYGNIDGMEIRQRVPHDQRLTLDGLSVWMTHIGGRPGRWDPEVEEELLAHPPDLFMCGHSHILRIERVPSLGHMLYINPGAAGRQGWHREKTCVRLYTREGTFTRAEVIHLDRWLATETSS